MHWWVILGCYYEITLQVCLFTGNWLYMFRFLFSPELEDPLWRWSYLHYTIFSSLACGIESILGILKTGICHARLNWLSSWIENWFALSWLIAWYDTSLPVMIRCTKSIWEWTLECQKSSASHEWRSYSGDIFWGVMRATLAGSSSFTCEIYLIVLFVRIVLWVLYLFLHQKLRWLTFCSLRASESQIAQVLVVIATKIWAIWIKMLCYHTTWGLILFLI